MTAATEVIIGTTSSVLAVETLCPDVTVEEAKQLPSDLEPQPPNPARAPRTWLDTCFGHAVLAPMDFENDTKKTFYGHFQEAQAGLEARIEQLPFLDPPARPEAIDACLATISRLSDVVKDASPFLPAYDQRSYSEQIRALSEKLSEVRKSLAPKQKFSFKNKRKDPTVSIGGAFKVSSSSHGPSSQSRATSTTPEADNLVISSMTAAHIRPSLSAASLTSTSFSSLLLSLIDRCVVSLPSQHTLFSSAAVKHVSSSLLCLGGSINGPLHITGLSSVTLVVACRQLRMHDAKNVDVYLLCSSRPIIEDCNGIRFAPLGKEGLGDTWEGVERNMWDQVDDFKWLKSEHSPNWSVLPEEERVDEKAWEGIRGKEVGQMSVEETLGSFVVKR